MKRLSGFKGLEEKDAASFSVPPPSEVGKQQQQQQEERFQSGLLEDGTEEAEEEDLCSFGQSSLGEKKRRLSMEQVKALEKNFEVENKLDPERKVRLAQEVGLQPRQVAIWFQNRRARWKTKQLERDYGVLRARHDALKLDFDALRRNKEALEANVRELKAELARSAVNSSPEPTNKKEEAAGVGEKKGAGFILRADGASDSDSSVVFNDEASPYSGAVLDHHCFVGFRSSSSSLFECTAQDEIIDCSGFFSEEREAPSLSWYCSEGWD